MNRVADRFDMPIDNDVRQSSRLESAIFVLLCFIAVISTIAYGAVDVWALGLLCLITAAVGILWAVDAWRTGEFRFNSSRVQLPIIGFLVIGLIQLLPLGGADIPAGLLDAPASSSLSLDPYSTRLFLIRLVIQIVFFAAALTFIDSEKRVKRTALLIIIFGGAMAFFAILQRLADPEAIYGLRRSSGAIPFGSFINRHHFAAFMELTSSITLALLFDPATKRDKKFLLGIAAFLMVIAIVFTASRGGMLSLAGLTCFVLAVRFLRPERRDQKSTLKRRLSLAVGAFAALILLLGTIAFLGGGEQLIRGIGLNEPQADISNGRSHFWTVGAQIFFENPIIGAGFDSFGVAFSQYDTWNGIFRVEQAHNDYLQTLADSGILGFACVAWFIFLLFRKGLNVVANSKASMRRGVAVGALAGCFGILIHSFFDFPLRTPSNAYFFLLLAVLATAQVSKAGKIAEK